MSLAPEGLPPAAPEASLSPWQRALAIFARPTGAWQGLDHQVQWFWPLVLIMAVSLSMSWFAYSRVIIPMQMERIDKQVEAGQLPPEQADKFEEQASSPMMRVISLGSQLVFVPAAYLLMAVVVWFGCGFVLGTKFRYRHALEVTTWSSLVTLPSMLLTYALAWQRGTFEGVHLGLAALLPADENPSKLLAGARIFLDQIGPFQVWHLVVAILGASILSGAARKNVAWVLISLYLALALFFSAVGAVFTPGA